MIDLWSIQEAVVSALQADGTLSSLVTAIRDEPLETDVFPYITIGDTDVQGDVNKTSTLFETRININVWSEAGSRKKVKQIMDRVVELLDDNPPALSTGSFVFLNFESMADFRDQDGFTYRGNILFRGLVA